MNAKIIYLAFFYRNLVPCMDGYVSPNYYNKDTNTHNILVYISMNSTRIEKLNRLP
jgi:hypothetical protein